MTQITRTEQSIDGLEFIRWAIAEDGDDIGFLDAHPSGLILNIEVSRECQREGFATLLFEHADAELGLLHAPTWGRSVEGDAFATRMGGDAMDDAEAAEILGLDLDQVTGAECAE